MLSRFAHSWDLTPTEAIALQRKLALSVELKNYIPLSDIRYICGVDCAPSVDKATYFASAVIWDLSSKMLIEYHIAEVELTFPYIPGLLSFREIPAILEVCRHIQHRFDVIMVDGHGIAHPRRFGIASHLGVLLDIPTLGCGKSLLCGQYQEPGINKGDDTNLYYKSEIIGKVLRTKTNIKPVIVSIGHKLDLATARELVLLCNTKYRLPEPTRLADKFVAEKQVKSVFCNSQGLL